MNRDSTLIMQLLRDNLTLWTSDMNESGESASIGHSSYADTSGADKKDDAEETKEEPTA
jgi:14-3-3 protein epsilon